MSVLCKTIALLSALTLSSAQFTYIFEVQDENRGPTSDLFGDLSQFKFIPPSQLPKNPVSARPIPQPQPQPLPTAPQPIARRQDQFEEQPVLRNTRLRGAAQNQRQFVVRAPQQDNRQELLRQELNQAPPQLSAPQPQPFPQPFPQFQYEAQPQNARPVAQPAPQTFPQLQPHQTAHLNPVLRTIVPRAQAAQPGPIPNSDPNFELLQNFVRSQGQSSNARPNAALQTLGQAFRFGPQPSQSLPQPPSQQHQPQPQPQPQPQLNSAPGVVLGTTSTGFPTLQISNKDSLTDEDLKAIEEHNRRVQAFLQQRQREAESQNTRGVRPPVRQPIQPPVRQPIQPPVRQTVPTPVDQNALNERLVAQRHHIQAQNAAQERALREREHRERVERERLLQRQIAQMLRPETREQVVPALESLPYLRSQPMDVQPGVEYTQPQEPQEQPEVRPFPISYNNVRVPDTPRRRTPATTPAPRNYAIPRTTSQPQPTAPQKPANLGLAALPPDTDSDGIPGEAGRDYPTLEEIPKTSFSCARQPLSGYYADTETACQVVHLCQFGGVQDSFLCPNGTIWNQEKFSCQWWYEVSCANAPRFYALNQDLYKLPEKDEKMNNNNNNNNKK